MSSFLWTLHEKKGIIGDCIIEKQQQDRGEGTPREGTVEKGRVIRMGSLFVPKDVSRHNNLPYLQGINKLPHGTPSVSLHEETCTKDRKILEAL